MVLDINGVEINVGDEVYCAFVSTMWKIRIVKETAKTIQYETQYKKDTKWIPRNKQVGDWSSKSFMYKSSNSFKNMLKV